MNPSEPFNTTNTNQPDTGYPTISPEVLSTLRKHLTQNGLVRPADFAHVASQQAYPDVAILIEALGSERFLTNQQVETSLHLFAEHQRATALRIAQTITTQNFLTEQNARHAIESYEEVLYSETFLEHLVHEELLTQTQATSLHKLTRSAPKNIPAWMQKLPVEKLSTLSTRLISTATTHRKKALLLGIPTALLLVALIAYNMFGNRLDPLEPDCNMNGRGQGTCTFSNTGTRPNGGCGYVTAWCDSILDSRKSSTMCSGQLEPRDSKQMDFSVGSFDRITPARGDWRDACSFIWVSVDD